MLFIVSAWFFLSRPFRQLVLQWHRSSAFSCDPSRRPHRSDHRFEVVECERFNRHNQVPGMPTQYIAQRKCRNLNLRQVQPHLLVAVVVKHHRLHVQCALNALNRLQSVQSINSSSQTTIGSAFRVALWMEMEAWKSWTFLELKFWEKLKETWKWKEKMTNKRKGKDGC